MGAGWGLLGEGAGNASRPPRPSTGSTSGPHRARSAPALQPSPLQLWVTLHCSKNRSQTKASPWASLRCVLPTQGSSKMADPAPQRISRVLGQVVSSSPQNFPFGLLQIQFTLGAQAHSPGPLASRSPAFQPYTLGMRLPPHLRGPPPAAGPTGLPTQRAVGREPAGRILPRVDSPGTKPALVGPGGAQGHGAGPAELLCFWYVTQRLPTRDNGCVSTWPACPTFCRMSNRRDFNMNQPGRENQCLGPNTSEAKNKPPAGSL